MWPHLMLDFEALQLLAKNNMTSASGFSDNLNRVYICKGVHSHSSGALQICAFLVLPVLVVISGKVDRITTHAAVNVK